jgi:hypothetical protein
MKTPTKKSLEFGFKTDQYGKDFICLTDRRRDLLQTGEGIREKT